MKIRVLAAFLFCMVAVPLHATTINLTVDDSDIGRKFGNGFIDFHSSAVNGTILNGQTITIDALLSNDVIARGWLQSPNSFGIGISFQTNAPGAPGFAGSGSTGYFLAPAGNAAFAPVSSGGGMGSNGTFQAGVNIYAYPQFNGATWVDITGAHFDIVMPTTGYTITDTRIYIFYNQGVSLGTSAQLAMPEPSSLALLPLGLIGLVWTGRKYGRKAI